MSGTQSQTQTNSSSVDPATKAYIEAYRQRAQNQTGYQTGLGNVSDYFNPYQDAVIGGVQSDFARQRALGQNAAADQATRAGAFGGSREAVLRANALNDVNQNETSTLANLRYSGYQGAVGQQMQDKQFAAQNALAQLNGLTSGFTPTSQYGTNTMTQKSSLLPQILGLGAQIGGAFLNPVGAVAGAATRAFQPNSISSQAPYIGASNMLNFGNAYGGGQSFGGQGGWNPQVFNPNTRYRNPWG